MFSPHTRGCSGLWCRRLLAEWVFPAYAGMFRCPWLGRHSAPCFPRIRGDVPIVRLRALTYLEFSPHTRGCSCLKKFVGQKRNVFPAYAGMFRRGYEFASKTTSFPRIRGDVPVGLFFAMVSSVFSPHTRGCSDRKEAIMLEQFVFPAYAGMFRAALSWIWLSVCFPRIRGDVPHPNTSQ